MTRAILTITLFTLLFVTLECQTIPQGPEHGAKLSRNEVIKIAKEKAKEEGYDLAGYDLKGCHYEYTRQDHTWTVFFEGKPPTAVGDDFLIWVDDHSKEAMLMPGE